MRKDSEVISARAILEEYCNSVTSPWEKKFVCNINNIYVSHVIQRLNMVDHCVTHIDRISGDDEPAKCIIEVEKSSVDVDWDDYGEDDYYK